MNRSITLKCFFCIISILSNLCNKADADERVPTELRISLGTPSREGMLPFMASLLQDYDHYCGGSIISKNLVLTAGHCCYDLDTKKQLNYEHLQVSVGSLYWKHGVLHKVSRNIIHEDFVLGNLPHDIALIVVEPAFIYSSVVKPIHLSPVRIQDEHEKVAAVVSGWGYTVVDKETIEEPSDVLMYVNVTTLPRKECKRRLSLDVLPSQICVFTGTGRGTCGADSGAPLISYGEQVGILSFGVDCMNRRPEVYTRVSDYFPWIMKQRKLIETGFL